MALRLRIVSEHSTRLGPRATKVFGVHGGSIGRSSDNEWILPDPERYLSGKHARVDFKAGTYVLVDTSSNGTYINGAQVPLGKYHDYQLKDGDYLRIGEYELLVSIDKSNDFPPDDSAIVAYDGKTPSSSAKKSTANDLGADLDLSILLETSDQPPLTAASYAADSGVRPRDAYGQMVMQSPAAAGEDSATPWHMLTRPLKVDSAKAADSGPPSVSSAGPPSISNRSFSGTLYDSDFEAALSSFCRGAGIELRSLNAEARSTALQLAGQILRESLLGLMDLHHGNHEFRNRFRISTAPAAVPESPLNLSKGVDETLVRLLNNLSTRAGSVEAIRNSFRELKAENAASFAAMHAAFEEFLGRVDPKELEERFERAGKRGVFGTPNKAKYWELYAEMYAGLAQRPDDGFPHLYTESFARAFEAKLRTLLPPKRNGFESDRSDDRDPGVQAVGDL
jgi:type VI secretion system FHA domain protein